MTPLERKISLAASAIHALGDGIDRALRINDDTDGGSDPELAAQSLESDCAAAKELLSYAIIAPRVES